MWQDIILLFIIAGYAYWAGTDFGGNTYDFVTPEACFDPVLGDICI